MIYLVHFETPYYHAQHYIGYAGDVEERLKRHGTSGGSKLLHVINQKGIGYKVVRTWEGGRQEERQLKRQKNAARYCPICSTKDFQNIDKSAPPPRRRVIGSSTIGLTPNPKYLQKHPEITSNIYRKRIVDLNKSNERRKKSVVLDKNRKRKRV